MFVRMENMWAKVVGGRVKEMRLARAWTQDDLARRMTDGGFPMHQTTVAKLENGTRPTSLDEIAAIAGLFDTPVGALFGRSEDIETTIRLTVLEQQVKAIEVEQGTLRQRLTELDHLHKSAVAEYQRFAKQVAKGAGK